MHNTRTNRSVISLIHILTLNVSEPLHSVLASSFLPLLVTFKTLSINNRNMDISSTLEKIKEMRTRSTRPIDAKLWKKFMSLKCLILKHFFTKHLHIKEPKYFRYFETFHIWCSKTFDIFDFKFGGGTYSRTYQSKCITSKNDYNKFYIHEFCYLGNLTINYVQL